MAKADRQKSKLGYYHVIMRSVCGQPLFGDKGDYSTFIFTLRRYLEARSLSLVAYCLMCSHVHLLLFDPEDERSDFLRRIAISYALYFNRRHFRCGHLYRDRYKCEAICDDRALLEVFRMILQHPEAAGITEADRYPWSSYGEHGAEDALTDTSVIDRLIGGPALFRDFLRFRGGDGVPCARDFDEMTPMGIDRAFADCALYDIIGTSDGTRLRFLSEEDRTRALQELRRIGLSASQLESLTGIRRSVIRSIQVPGMGK